MQCEVLWKAWKSRESTDYVYFLLFFPRLYHSVPFHSSMVSLYTYASEWESEIGDSICARVKFAGLEFFFFFPVGIVAPQLLPSPLWCWNRIAYYLWGWWLSHFGIYHEWWLFSRDWAHLCTHLQRRLESGGQAFANNRILGRPAR